MSTERFVLLKYLLSLNLTTTTTIIKNSQRPKNSGVRLDSVWLDKTGKKKPD